MDPYAFPPAIIAATTHLSKPHVANLRDVFQILDENKQGVINLRDLPVALNLGDLETTQQERTGLVAVHVADRDAGVTELEFLTICDVVASSRAGVPEFSSQEQLRRAFDALASHEHGVVPIEGVLKWGEDVMRACDECLLLEHGFEYDPSQLLVLGGGGGGNNNVHGKRRTSAAGLISLDEIPSYDEHDDDDDHENNNKKKKGIRSSQQQRSENDEFIAQQLEKRRKDQIKQEREQAEAMDVNSGLPLRTKLRRRSSSAMLVPRNEDEDADDNDDDDENNSNDDDDAHQQHAKKNRRSSVHNVAGSSSPLKNLSLPEVAARQKLTGNRYDSFADRTIGGRTLLSHHQDATQVFGTEDVEGTTQWLLQFLGDRYQSASESEKREIEMLMELARAAGHQVESVSGVLTRDAFVKFVKEMRGDDYDDGTTTAGV